MQSSLILVKKILPLLLTLIVFACGSEAQGPSADDKKTGPFVFCPQTPCKDTLDGWFDTGLTQDGVPRDSSHMINIKAVGNVLFAENYMGQLFRRDPLTAKWSKIGVPTIAHFGQAMVVSNSKLYIGLVDAKKILEIDASGNVSSEVALPPESDWCGSGSTNCKLLDLTSFGNQFIVSLSSADSNYNYWYFIRKNNRWIKISGIHPYQNSSGFRNYWNSGDTMLVGSTYQSGLYYLKDSVWHPFPVYNRFMEVTGDTILDTVPVRQWGGATTLGGQLYAADWTGELFQFKNEQLTPVPIVNKHYFIYELDTLCGRIALLHTGQFWKPGTERWTGMPMPDSSTAYRQYHPFDVDRLSMGSGNLWGYNGIGYSMARIGDTLYIAHGTGSDYRGDDESINWPEQPGKVVGFNLQNSPLCADAWARGQAKRAKK